MCVVECMCVCVLAYPEVKGAVGPVVLFAVRWAEEKLLSTKHIPDAENQHVITRTRISLHSSLSVPHLDSYTLFYSDGLAPSGH